ncbi:hypothetical protein J2X56_005086 [Herbaspirillum sp. 1173]|uniref:hypothetical protein n=1 Tax=Herbaspirillum sp. 1173 TaxID=2817734 RepID=UPI00285CD206|nr:hypothetical protein [Herbaspirillum sp. 1173]MDR6743051.1 hypothetical protein [Herbaspirillum sp. 1173]
MKKNIVRTGFNLFVALWFIAASILAIDAMRVNIAWEVNKFVWELLKVVVGPFIGATLAFSFNRWLQEDRRREDESAEIYGAAALIRSMYVDFLRYRRCIHDVAADREEFHRQFEGVAPIWTYAGRMLFTFNAAGDADLKALHFLNSSEAGRTAFASYLHLIKAYKDLETADSQMSPMVDAIQDKLEKIEKIDWEKDSEAIGPRLTYSVRDLYLGLLLRLEDEQFYVKAYDDLAKVASEHYPKMKLVRLSEPGEGYKQADLRQLPQVVIDELKKGRNPQGGASP